MYCNQESITHNKNSKGARAITVYLRGYPALVEQGLSSAPINSSLSPVTVLSVQRSFDIFLCDSAKVALADKHNTLPHYFYYELLLKFKL